MRSKREGGFTLLELLIVVVMLASIMVWLGPTFKEMLGAIGNADRRAQEQTNFKIADALMKYARTKDTLGKLPAPYSGAGSFSAPVNPANANLVALMNENGVLKRQLNDDGKQARSVRVYQMTDGLSIDIPLNFQSGPLVTLNYGVGVVYQTTCTFSATCNKSPYPGNSAAYTVANLATWTPANGEYGAASVSTLPLQQSMLESTARVLDRLRDGFLSYYKDRAVTAAANDQSNFFPVPASGLLSGRDPFSNQGCRDGWYSLSNASIAMLDQLSLNRGQYGVTAWGGAIEFCRKYDLAGTVSEALRPHFGALRINRNVSQGIAPSNTASENIILTF